MSRNMIKRTQSRPPRDDSEQPTQLRSVLVEKENVRSNNFCNTVYRNQNFKVT